jgi:DNA-binding CsgD family transcriptional regulator
MLPIIESLLDQLMDVRSDLDIVMVLSNLAQHLGYRSASLHEYAYREDTLVSVWDTYPARASLWNSDVRHRARLSKSFSKTFDGDIQSFNLNKGDARWDIACQLDLVDYRVVPITYGQRIAGAAFFSGDVATNPMHDAALRLMENALLAKGRFLKSSDEAISTSSLTPRECEVLRLSADGFTSEQAGYRLGIAKRTVDQHLENASTKLGTRNRVQTVVQAIRLGLA